jgi:hypothetical protein
MCVFFSEGRGKTILSIGWQDAFKKMGIYTNYYTEEKNKFKFKGY